MPDAVLPLVIAGIVDAVILTTNGDDPVPLELIALIVAVVVPVAVGVPVIAPVLVFTPSPPGNPLAL